MESRLYIIPEYVWGAMTVAQEAIGEPYEGKVAVAEEILYRTKMKRYSDGTVMGTVLFPYQYSGWNTKDQARINIAHKEWHDPRIVECLKAWQEALGGSNYSKGATHHLNPKVLPSLPDWMNKLPLVAEIGNHKFYKEF